MKSAGKARNNGLYRHIRTSKEIIRNLLNDSDNNKKIVYKMIVLHDIIFLKNINILFVTYNMNRFI